MDKQTNADMRMYRAYKHTSDYALNIEDCDSNSQLELNIKPIKIKFIKFI